MFENKKALLWFVSKTSTHRFSISLILLSVCAISYSLVNVGNVFGKVVNNLRNNNIDLLDIEILRLIFFIGMFSISSFLRSYLSNTLADDLVFKIKFDLYKSLLNQNVSFFYKRKVSEVNYILTNCIESVRYISSTLFAIFVRNNLMFILSLFQILKISFKLSAILFFCIFFIVIPTSYLGKALKKKAKDINSIESKINTFINESLSGIRIIHAFNKTENQTSFLNGHFKSLLSKTVSRNILRATFFSVFIFSISCMVALLIWTSSKDIISSHLESGQLVSFIFFSITIIMSFSGIVQELSQIQKNLLLLKDVYELNVSLDGENTKRVGIISSNSKTNAKKQDLEFSKIEFLNVSFAYPSRNDFDEKVFVLKNFSASFKSGLNIISGSSGVGKSTLFDLFLKFYDEYDGRIQIDDNTDIKNISSDFLRSFCGYVPQDPYIFSDSLRNNIAFLDDSFSDEEIFEILKVVEMHDFIENIKGGYKESINLFVGNDGKMLSGGQKQKLAIARALIRKPKILLLDESTNAIDRDSEERLIRNIKHFMNGKIVMLVTHKQSLFQEANNMVFLSNKA